MSREATKDTQHHNAAIASQCYTACIDLLRTESDDPMRESSTHSIHKSDENDLKSKCLVQLALALHLSEKHDEALDALNLVESKELLQDAEDLRFGILLAVRETNTFCFVEPPFLSFSHLSLPSPIYLTSIPYHFSRPIVLMNCIT